MISRIPTSKMSSRAACRVGVLNLIGDTPLVDLQRYLDARDVRLFAKLEAYNPGGSAKDRPARQMIEHGFAHGLLNQESTVIESSSGNMGIGLAQACRYHNLQFICVVDPYAQSQNVAMMQALGAKIDRVVQRVDGDFLSARLARVQWWLDQTPNSFWPNQYSNKQNPLSHQLSTIREIDVALNGDLDYLFVATSSTGTARGCRDYLRSRGRKTKVVAVDAVGSVLFGGQRGPRKIPGLGAGRLPPLAANQCFDLVRRTTDVDCVVGCRRMARREALLVGGSAGGVLESIRKMEERLKDKTCVAILHDSGTRYLDTIYSDTWVERELGVSPADLELRIQQPATDSPPTGVQEVVA